MTQLIPIFIGVDPHEQAAINILIDILMQNSSMPLAITPMLTPQLEKQGLYWRERDPKQATAFSFSCFVLPKLMAYQGWVIFIYCDMLFRGDIAELWTLRDERFPLLCVHHEHVPGESVKFLGEVQSAYPEKSWSSLMLLNCRRCTKLSVDYVNISTGLDLHRFYWLEGNHEIGSIKGGCNYLMNVQAPPKTQEASPMLHWTLGEAWFRCQRTMGGSLAAEWFSARDDAMKLLF